MHGWDSIFYSPKPLQAKTVEIIPPSRSQVQIERKRLGLSRNGR
jgi:hypothetical protein